MRIKATIGRRRFFYHYISRPNVLIDMPHVLILDLHDTFDVHDAYDLHNLILSHGIKSLRFDNSTRHLGLYDHHETFPMCVVICEESEHDEFFSHGEHLRKNMISCVPKFALHDLLMKRTHGASLVRRDGLRFRDRWIVHKRGKIKILVHGCRISLLVFNSHWIDMAMEFVLKCPRSKRGKHFLSMVW